MKVLKSKKRGGKRGTQIDRVVHPAKVDHCKESGIRTTEAKAKGKERCEFMFCTNQSRV